MKNLIKLIILVAILAEPISAMGQEAVLKSYKAPVHKVQTTKTKKAVPSKNVATKHAEKKKVVKAKNTAKPLHKNVTKRPVVAEKLIKQPVSAKYVATKDTNKKLAKLTNKVNPQVAPTPEVAINNTCNAMETTTVQPMIPAAASHPPSEYIYKDSTANISSVDPTVGTAATSYFPGLRGSNQLVIYTPSYGIKTGTNEFGSEAIVMDNTVVQINGADSLIPRIGFVVSGHGSAKKWINENVTVGSKIFVDLPNSKIHSYLTADSFIFAAKEKIKEANSIMDYYRNQDILYDDRVSQNYIYKAKESLRKAEKDPDNAQVYISTATEAANQAIKNALPYKPEELKGVWIRPTQKNPEEIVKAVEKLKNAGINNIFLETYFHGKTIYPSQVLNNYNVSNQNEDFVGFDPLRIWVDECHKRGIKVNIWFETFYVGNQAPSSNPKNVLSVYPCWANTTKAGYASATPVASLSEHNGYFIDPANPEVQKYLLCILTEIIKNYSPDGINLDYIRYPQSVAAKFSNYDMTNWGYTWYAREEFKKSYCVDPVDIKYNTPAWDLWAKYRQDRITKFVCSVRRLTQENNIKLTTVVFPDRQRSLETKMQDWKTWSMNNYIDGFTPLILTSDKETAASMISDIKNNANPCTQVYPGLFVTFMGGSFDDLLMQIHEARKLDTNGVVLFDYAHLDTKYVDALKARVYNPNKPAVETRTNSRPYPKKKRRWFHRG